MNCTSEEVSWRIIDSGRQVDKNKEIALHIILRCNSKAKKFHSSSESFSYHWNPSGSYFSLRTEDVSLAVLHGSAGCHTHLLWNYVVAAHVGREAPLSTVSEPLGHVWKEQDATPVS